MPAKSKTKNKTPTVRPTGLLSPRSYETRAELYSDGKAIRSKCTRAAQATWKSVTKNRPTLQILAASNEGRVPELIPIRHGRMLQSPFTFYRGSAALMAADLSKTPSTGEYVQACGDCHLSNFGSFATPERNLIFDINDFDETLPAPWEWDLKRLAASFVVAGRNNQFTEAQCRDSALAAARSYREKMAEYAEMRTLDVWYARIDVLEHMRNFKDKEARKRAKKRLKKTRTRSVVDEDFPKLAHTDLKHPVIRDNPPLIFHPQEINEKHFSDTVRRAYEQYRESLSHERRILLDRYQLMDIASKVVGVGSVGTICAIMLLMAEKDDPLFLQVKQARPSVLEPYAKKSLYKNHGQRVVVGQRIMQSASDMFLGWTEGRFDRHFYVRQLRDMKIKPLVELFNPSFMIEYAEYCGWALARSHARSGRPAFLSGYMGDCDKIDQAIANFAVAYADQNESDYADMVKAAKRGDIEAYIEK